METGEDVAELVRLLAEDRKTGNPRVYSDWILRQAVSHGKSNHGM